MKLTYKTCIINAAKRFFLGFRFPAAFLLLEYEIRSTEKSNAFIVCVGLERMVKIYIYIYRRCIETWSNKRERRRVVPTADCK